MRTVIAPLDGEVQAQLEALDARLGEICRRYIRRLAFEPLLGHTVERGYLGTREVRAIYVDRADRPEDLFGGRRAARQGDADPSAGPRWRVVYAVRETRDRRLRVIVVLGVGVAHPEPGHDSIYITAARTMRRLFKEKTR